MTDRRSVPAIRTGQGPGLLDFEEFRRRFVSRFYDPNFRVHASAIDALLDTAWNNYCQSRKSPITRPAGEGFADPSYELSVEWLAARAAILEAQQRHDDPAQRTRVLVIGAADRNDKTCPGEMAKSYRMAQIAIGELQSLGIEVDALDLSLLASEYGRVIYPCKGCVSTAMPLCHWPCSCYPNHSLGQTSDWMNDLYPRWVAAHGILIITPVYWYQAPSALKLMIDRLVCADGGNPDPSSTHGKKVDEAKAMELEGWTYPRHLAERSYALIVHGDAAGTEALRHALSNCLDDMGLISAGARACIDRLIGYYEPYASSHEAFDADHALHQEIRNAARLLGVQAVRRRASPSDLPTAECLPDPRPK
ncbi:MAG TPA: flavodoxin family protein [Steroidobacteraceae bacterium]